MPDNDLLLAQRIVKEAGELALFLRTRGLEIENKQDGSLVTSGDKGVNTLIRKRITEARPDDGWQSEETIDDGSRLRKQRVWIVDPIDGTRDYAYGGVNWCVGLGLMVDGVPEIAALFQPVSRTLYLARVGEGATRNGEPMRVSSRESLEGMKVITTEHERRWLKPRGAVLEPSRDRPFLLRLALIASGEIDAVVTGSAKHDWDLVPGVLLVTEAGGMVSNRHGAQMIFNQVDAKQDGIVAANPVCHAAIINAQGTT